MESTIIVNMPLLNETWIQESIEKTKFLKLPLPSSQAIQHSEQLIQTVRSKIHSQGGFISFAEYMQLALYEPGLGYYAAGNQKFGRTGDFVTAPEISPLFSYCLANQCNEVLKKLNPDMTANNATSSNTNSNKANILELGAGSGKMAADILMYLSSINALPQRYFILEVSAELKQRQHNTLQQHCPELLPCVEWINTLPKPGFKGVILANEVCDAMPVHRICWQDNTLSEIGVTAKADALQLQLMAQPVSPTSALSQAFNEEYFAALLDEIKTFSHYSSELNLNISPWIQSLAHSLEEGVVLIIDYGFPKQEFYHPSRSMGTLMCHYRHYAHNDPLLWPGLQDITAHVDFTLIAEAAFRAGLNVTGFTNQASFLLSAGLLEFAQNKMQAHKNQMVINQAIQTLTSPAEMGELFKIIALSKNYSYPIHEFLLNDMRHRL